MHAEFETLAALDAAGVATPEEKASLRDHTQSCAECRRGHEELVRAAAVLGHDSSTPTEVTRQQIVSAAADVGLAPTAPHRTHRPMSRWLTIVALLFLALWVWREAGIRVAREHVTAQAAEIRQLNERVKMLEHEKQHAAAPAATATSQPDDVVPRVDEHDLAGDAGRHR